MKKTNKLFVFLSNLFKEKPYLDVKWMRAVDAKLERLEYLIEKDNHRNK